MFPKTGNKLPAGTRGGAEGDFAVLISVALRSELGATHQAIKLAMGWTGASEHTVKHWFAGTHGPSGQHLVDLSSHSNLVLEPFLVMAGRGPALVSVKLTDLRQRLVDAVDAIDKHL